MIARVVRLFWLAALLAMLVAATLSMRWFGRSIGMPAAALAGIFAVALLHPLFVGLNFIVSRRLGDRVPPDTRLSTWQAIKMWDAEIDASARGLWFATPFLCDRPAASPPAEAPHRRHALLFVHGYFCNRAIWLSFMRDAAARGYVCEAITLADAFGSIDGHADHVARAIDALLDAARSQRREVERVVIVAHSMGGLVVRAALQRMDAAHVARIAHVVTLGTPHHGTHAARYARFDNVRQMRVGSRWLASLDETERTSGRGLPRDAYTALFTAHDDIVYPQRSAMLEGATNVALAGIGHVALAYDRRVRSAVFERIAALEGATGAQAATATGT